MNFILILACTVAAVFILREPIRRWPYVFYALAIALDILLFACSSMKLPPEITQLIVKLMTRGGLGAALFIVVMYIGVLPRKTSVSRWLRGIRAELSIIACLLIAGHMVYYLLLYCPRFFEGKTVIANILWAIIVGVVMLAFIIVLGVTSFRAIKRYMNIRTWRRLQSGAYIFYALIFVHVICMLGPSAVKGGATAMTNLIVYSVLLIGYMVLRILRARADKRDRVDLDKTVEDQGFTKLEG
ncbi:MAG: ferric reductase-like transmembrane domain-containing protein [Coriobacteriales bacterium]|nr:ferric reductase-like transmembrane domain-containing protein [Coriobacteriales bacterium]